MRFRRLASLASPATPHGRDHGLRSFGLRVVTHACKLSHGGVRQDLGGLFKNVAARYRVVKSPHEM